MQRAIDYSWWAWAWLRYRLKGVLVNTLHRHQLRKVLPFRRQWNSSFRHCKGNTDVGYDAIGRELHGRLPVLRVRKLKEAQEDMKLPLLKVLVAEKHKSRSYQY